MAPPTDVKFELQRLALEGDELVVRGLWTGVHGMRFVRPALLCGDRRILATLEHKPWAPSDDAPWTAAFAWTGGETVDAASLALVVAPRVTVPLGEESSGAIAAAKPATPAPAAKPANPAPAPGPTSNGAPPPTPPVIAVDERADDLARALAAAERDRDRALAQLAEAVESRKAAVRTRARMELAHDEALEAQAAAEAALARADAERQEALAQRDEVLIAYRAMQRQLQAEHAEADRKAGSKPEEETDSDSDADEPLGVRTVPAVRSVMAELQYPRRETKLRLTQFDLWVVRLLGVAAAACFFLLLFSILRVVI